jgi:hypothetical protein
MVKGMLLAGKEIAMKCGNDISYWLISIYTNADKMRYFRQQYSFCAKVR